MIDIEREVARVRYPVLAISALAWIALAAGAVTPGPGMRIYCSASGGGAPTPAASLSLLLALNPPSALAAGWALMLVAMMSPLLIPAVHHIRFTSLARRRPRSIALFVVGYGGVWMLCGAALRGFGLVATASVPGPHVLLACAGLVACVWQASPLKQRCLNGCHDRPSLRAFGLEADLDAFRFGWTHGAWCAGSCSALMLLPLLLPDGHLVAMVAVAILIFCERLEDSKPPEWKLRGLGKARRMIEARIRIRWRTMRRGYDLLPEQ